LQGVHQCAAAIGTRPVAAGHQLGQRVPHPDQVDQPRLDIGQPGSRQVSHIAAPRGTTWSARRFARVSAGRVASPHPHHDPRSADAATFWTGPGAWIRWSIIMTTSTVLLVAHFLAGLIGVVAACWSA
jgi:hypothetical protein